MRKELKYRIRRLIFLYIPFIALIAGIEILACIKAGIYVL